MMIGSFSLWERVRVREWCHKTRCLNSQKIPQRFRAAGFFIAVRVSQPPCLLALDRIGFELGASATPPAFSPLAPALAPLELRFFPIAAWRSFTSSSGVFFRSTGVSEVVSELELSLIML